MKPKSIFITYKENTQNLLDAKSDLDYNRRMFKQCNPLNNHIYNGFKEDDLLTRIVKLEEYIKSVKTFQKELEKQIRDYANTFNDLEYRVYIGYHIENKSLREIADELQYSYSHIKSISCNLSKKIE